MIDLTCLFSDVMRQVGLLYDTSALVVFVADLAPLSLVRVFVR